MKCANHPDRLALGYCATCGKALCSSCLVRTSSGNYCETCAARGDQPAKQRRGIPWWAVALGILALLILVRAIAH
ncbi:MAG TPA: B-box zinc finger protein [bacterium]|nr:B-box zinc finger protein [bacterium]